MKIVLRFVMPIVAATTILTSCSAAGDAAAPASERHAGPGMVEEVLEILATRDFARLAAWTGDQGLLVSPYLFIAPGRLRLTRAEVARCARDPRIREWGTWDGRGDPILMTCAEYFDRLVWVADFRRVEQTAFDRPLRDSLEPDNHRDVFPEAFIAWKRREGYQDGAGRHYPWQSLHLIFVEERGRWRLAAIVRGTRVI